MPGPLSALLVTTMVLAGAGVGVGEGLGVGVGAGRPVQLVGAIKLTSRIQIVSRKGPL